jgi:DNA-binding transcriptional LysR family regulator
MTVDDLVERANAQQPVTVQRMISVPGPQLRALLAESRAILVSELDAHPDQRKELRTFRYGHLLGPGLLRDEIQAWQNTYPHLPLPPDLASFLVRVNGIHLWADLESSHTYFGIAPLDQWQDVKELGWASMYQSSPVGQLVISYHDNGDYFLILDTHKQQYLWYDLEDFDHPKHIGNRVPELLDFWWQETAWLDPRRRESAG